MQEAGDGGAELAEADDEGGAAVEDVAAVAHDGFGGEDHDDKGLYLYARSTALLADLKRDQGAVLGPLSAQHSYTGARSIFTQLDIPRRVAQLDLSLAVVTEMSGNLEASARTYETLAVDDRLSRRDRARARLWVGTALSKDGNHDYATRVMRAATREFEDLPEPDDWSVAHQKLALARRGAGDLTAALHFIDIARNSGSTDSPMQRVRLDTAHGEEVPEDVHAVYESLIHDGFTSRLIAS